MEYTVRGLADIAGISTRTLRHYDSIGLLNPARLSASGYRLYGPEQVAQLQHILFYRELGLGLTVIRDILQDPDFDSLKALKDHREQLLTKRRQLGVLLANVDHTIAATEGSVTMSDAEKFDGFKRQLIADNEARYGPEIRARYGNDVSEASYAKIQNLSPEDYAEWICLGEEINAILRDAFQAGDAAGEKAQKAAELHKRWLSVVWAHYNPAAHRGLAQLYVDDDRFRAFYDAEQPGMATFLRDAIHIYTTKPQ